MTSPLRGLVFASPFRDQRNPATHSFDERLTPHYLQPAPIDEVLRKVEPGLDEFLTEKYAAQIKGELEKWTAALTQPRPDFSAIENSISTNLVASNPAPRVSTPLRPQSGLEVFRAEFSKTLEHGKTSFLKVLEARLGEFSSLLTAEFKVARISVTGDPNQPDYAQTLIRYDLVGRGTGIFRGELVGHWDIRWARDSSDVWQVSRWQTLDEQESKTSAPIFVDVTSRAFGPVPSYQQQMVYGADHWRTILDAASRVDVYGNNGIAVGDIDGDGFEDVYVCQPSGLPNRLYRNRGDGTFEDVTEQAGVDVLDSTSCAVFADVRNSGLQDLIVVCVDGPLVFLNDGKGKFQLKPYAFKFARQPLGTFTGAALADYDGDGFLDIYFGLYSYYLGLNQYQYPAPYYDAQNGPPNFLMHNQGDGIFADVTKSAGMNVNNNRYTFTCGWVDFDHDGRPDLYVVNDFGKKNLYRNNGDGTFTDVAREAGLEDVGAGMSVCWFDYDNDGKQDLYVADMWSAAGSRVSTQPNFLEGAPEEVRAQLRKHAEGNSLFRNEGAGPFTDQGAKAGVQMGRWSWSSYAWDFDHDGYEDLYIANGMISGPDRKELSSFFWRQTVAETPIRPNDSDQIVPSKQYELGWNAINELIRSDGTWSGYERNNFFVNNRDGSFSEVAGTVGLDFMEDSRTFALADFDHDGRLEVLLKNRSGPQLRLLRNETTNLAASIAFRLRGTRSNRDAIGAEVTLEGGSLRQTKFVQAGGGFLAQHTKDLYFGAGNMDKKFKATVRWPGGLMQTFENVPAGNLVLIEEGKEGFDAQPFRPGDERATPTAQDQGKAMMAARPGETWLLAPVAAPDFSLPDTTGRVRKLSGFGGHLLLLNFWRTSSQQSVEDLSIFEKFHARWAARGLQVAALNLNPEEEADKIKAFVGDKRYTFPILLAAEDTAAVYNILYHYLFDRRRNIGIPTSFLVDGTGKIVKVYQGALNATSIEADVQGIPQTMEERHKKGLPFPGRLYGNEFRRNEFTYALVFMERGFVDQALSSCKTVLQQEPENAEAHYLMGMIYLQKKMPGEARTSFERVIHLTPSQPGTWPDAWNNLGLLAAQDGRSDEAIANFQKAVRLNPAYTVALQNLGNVSRQQRRWADAQSAFERALKIEPGNPDVNYGLAMTFAQKGDNHNAENYFGAALKSRPDYPEALNNLGVLYLNTQRADEGVKSFETCIRVAPNFEQAYINLAKVYAQRGQKDQAVEVLHRLLQRHPKQALAQRMLEELTP